MRDVIFFRGLYRQGVVAKAQMDGYVLFHTD